MTLLTASLMEYAPLRASAMPKLILQTVSTPSPTHPLGVKGIGSVTTAPAPAAVVNAVLDTLSRHGMHNLDMPLTPEKIWRAGCQHTSPR